MSDTFPKAADADIALLLEGTFPFVSGGVSSWVNQIIRGFPEYRFAAVFIGSHPDDYAGIRYTLPDNLVHLEAHYLFGEARQTPAKAIPGNARAFDKVRELHEWFFDPARQALDPMAKQLAFYLDPQQGVDEAQFLHSRQSWDYITEMYERRCTDPSFVDYFWTVRNMHAPIWLLARIARQLIPARVYHSVSTGYAGFLGALLKHHHQRPFILSEHGIYTKERRIDLLQSQLILDNRSAFQRDPAEISYYRALWIRFFEALGRFCYEAADPIVSLFEDARQRQIMDGADAARTTVIPNGIDLPRLRPLREQRPADPPPVLCLLGRVVPIKDIKTFIRAMRIVVNRLPEAEGWIVGPTDEDPEYAQECRDLAESLGLEHSVKFLGFRKIAEILPKVGLLVLSSISEGLPLVVLEGYAAGVPVVSTDVGSCRQLVFGQGAEDEALGASGDIVRIADPQALAEASLRLLQDPARWRSAQAAAIRRVERFYTQEQMFASYRDIYARALG